MRGTVFFRESTSTRTEGKAKKQGTWTFAFSVPKAGGGRRQISKGGFSTKRAAERALTEAMAEHGRSPNSVVEPSKTPLAQFARDEWLPTRARLKPATADSYQLTVDAYISRAPIGDVRLCDLTAGQIAKFYAWMREPGRRANGSPKPLSESTVHKAHVVLNAALSYAVKTGRLRVSPMAMLADEDRPKQLGANRPEMKVWTAEQARTFIAASSGDRFAALFELDLNTGLRRGELLGLQWVDGDLDAGVLRIRRSRVLVDDQVHEVTPKGGKSRVVDIDPGTVALLKAHRRRQREERMAWGEAWTDTGYVFTREDGTLIHPDQVSSRLEMLIRRAGVPRIRVHDLRHTHATLGLAAGVPLKVMSERLGHATTQITADLYQHVIPGMGADAAAKIAGLLRQSQ